MYSQTSQMTTNNVSVRNKNITQTKDIKWWNFSQTVKEREGEFFNDSLCTDLTHWGFYRRESIQSDELPVELFSDHTFSTCKQCPV